MCFSFQPIPDCLWALKVAWFTFNRHELPLDMLADGVLRHKRFSARHKGPLVEDRDLDPFGLLRTRNSNYDRNRVPSEAGEP